MTASEYRLLRDALRAAEQPSRDAVLEEALNNLAIAAEVANAYIRSNKGTFFPSEALGRADMLVELESALSHAGVVLKNSALKSQPAESAAAREDHGPRSTTLQGEIVDPAPAADPGATPRTDAHLRSFSGCGRYCDSDEWLPACDAEFTRKLEHKLDAALTMVRICASWMDSYAAMLREIKTSIDALRKEKP